MPPLDPTTLKRHLLSVSQCTTREGLGRLTRLLWRQYAGKPENETAMAQLRTRIEFQRAILDRSDQR